VAETPKKQAKTAHIDHFRGPTKMMAAAGRLKDGKTPFERLFFMPCGRPPGRYFLPEKWLWSAKWGAKWGAKTRKKKSRVDPHNTQKRNELTPLRWF